MFEFNIETAVKAAVAAIGTSVTYIIGGWDTTMTILVFAVVIDYASGVLRAAAEGSLNSRIGLKGIVKKIGFFLLVATANLADQALGTSEPVIRTATSFFLVANELLSVTENLGAAGVPIPDVLRRAIELLREKSDRGIGEDDKK